MPGWRRSTQRPAFRGLLSHNRCLMPASGYYEWKAEGRDKTPYYIHPEDEQFSPLPASTMSGPTPKVRTSTPSPSSRQMRMTSWHSLHNRMPVILARELEDAWLDPELTKAQDVLDVLSPKHRAGLDAYPVSRMVNKPSVDSQALIQRVE